jgi:serine/threonine protein phosphatase PrpC
VWRVVAASVAGTSHATLGTRCEDYHAFRVLEGERGTVAILGLADGAGSAADALYGAKTAVDAAVGSMAAALQREREAALQVETLRDAILAAHNSVFQAADDFGHLPEEYASTLLLAVATPERTLVAHIGDGAIVVEDDALRILSFPDQGEYANATRFITDGDALAATRFVEHRGARRVALLSDGLQALALEYASRSAYEPFFAPIFERIADPSVAVDELNAELSAWLGSAAINARTHDDKSLVVAVRME